VPNMQNGNTNSSLQLHNLITQDQPQPHIVMQASMCFHDQVHKVYPGIALLRDHDDLKTSLYDMK
jgi:hypothetical protein